MILSAQSIRRLALQKGMISPFNERSVVEGKSRGLSGCSYDLTIDQTVTVWPGWGRLASTVERIELPNNVAAMVLDKSSYARVFLQSQNTFLDAGFKGFVTLELARHKPWPIRIKEGSPIVQLVFLWLDEATDAPYRGKYYDQERGPQTARREE